LTGAPVPRVRVWDLPTRLFHLAIVLLVPALWATHELDDMDLHILLGEIMLGLVLFRLTWGVIGSSTARFGQFVRGPVSVARYIRGRAGEVFGHSPIGGWSVLAMLVLLAVQVGLGLFASDEDNLYSGPLARHVTEETSHILRDRHETVFYILLAVIVLHVAAILYYLVARRDNLVTPMVTGRRVTPAGGGAMTPAPLWRFLLAAALAGSATWIVSNYL
jgi:cytochrome b